MVSGCYLRHVVGALLVVAVVTSGVEPARAHNGRRFLIEVVDGKLQAQGVNTGAPDGAPGVRPYVNAIHDHWRNVTPDPVTGLAPFASTTLPDFEVQVANAFVALKNHRVSLKLLAAWQWVDPPSMPTPGLVPDLQRLDPSRSIRIEAGSVVTSDSLGELLLSPSVPQSGIADIPVLYSINSQPVNEIHVLQFRMTAAPTDLLLPDLVADSDPIYVILSPAATGMHHSLHHASLFLEGHLAARSLSVPEPGGLAMLVLVGGGALLGGWVRPRRA